MEYCKNLWIQFGEITKAQQIAVAEIKILNREGTGIEKVENAFSNFELELARMNTAWENCYIEISDGGRLFGPEFEALQEIEKQLTARSNVYLMLRDGTAFRSEDGHVTTIQIQQDALKDLSAFPRFRRLKNLQLRQNHISDISPLAQIPELEMLWLSQNKVEDLSPIAALTNMRELFLGSNRISDVRPLGEVKSLERLYLEYNNIQSLEGLEGLVNLRELRLSKCPISDISPIENLPSLKTLWLDETPAKDVQEDKIQALIDRGVDVVLA